MLARGSHVFLLLALVLGFTAAPSVSATPCQAFDTAKATLPQDPPVSERVRQIIADQLWLELSEVDMHDDLSHLGADKLDLTEILLELESEFGIEIPDSEWNNWSDVSSVVESVTKRI